MIDAGETAALGDVGDERFHRGLVLPAKRPGFGEQFLVALDVAEQHRIVERQFDLIRIEYLKNQHLVTLMLTAAEGAVESIEVGEQIADDDDDAATGDLVGETGEHGTELGGAIRLRSIECFEDFGELRLRGRRSQPQPLRIIANRQPRGIALANTHGRE